MCTVHSCGIAHARQCRSAPESRLRRSAAGAPRTAPPCRPSRRSASPSPVACGMRARDVVDATRRRARPRRAPAPTQERDRAAQVDAGQLGAPRSSPTPPRPGRRGASVHDRHREHRAHRGPHGLRRRSDRRTPLPSTTVPGPNARQRPAAACRRCPGRARRAARARGRPPPSCAAGLAARKIDSTRAGWPSVPTSASSAGSTSSGLDPAAPRRARRSTSRTARCRPASAAPKQVLALGREHPEEASGPAAPGAATGPA